MSRIKFSVEISYITADELTTFNKLRSHHDVYGDLRVMVGDERLPGIERISAGEYSIGKLLHSLLLLRRFSDPSTKTRGEVIVLSGYEYIFEFVVKDGEDVLLLSVMFDDDFVPGFECIDLDLKQVQEELHRFRKKLQDLFLESCPLENSSRWWVGNVFEDFDDAGNPKGKY